MNEFSRRISVEEKGWVEEALERQRPVDAPKDGQHSMRSTPWMLSIRGRGREAERWWSQVGVALLSGGDAAAI